MHFRDDIPEWSERSESKNSSFSYFQWDQPVQVRITQNVVLLVYIIIK